MEDNNEKKKKGLLGSKSILLLAIVLIAMFILVILIAVIKDQELDEVEKGSDAVEEYTDNVSIDEDGEISFGGDIQELWDKLKEEDNPICKYLDSPEELAKLIRAEMITKYPDTRPGENDEGYDKEGKDWKKNINVDINWEEFNKDLSSKSIQGIVKLKRADENGNEKTLTYVSKDKFADWMEQYNINGEESARNNLLTHFTLDETSGSGRKGRREISPDDISTEVSQKILDAIDETPPAGPGWCQAWVANVYVNAVGGERVSYASAYAAYDACFVSEDMTNIPIGASVYATGWGSDGRKSGHVGIYVGNGKVADNQAQKDANGNAYGVIVETDLSKWIAQQEAEGNKYDGKCGWLGWGWQPNLPTLKSDSNNMNSSSSQNSSNSESDSNSEKAQVCAVIATIDTSGAATKEIPYQQLTAKYSMPFNYLWALLVVGQNKEFVLDLADLVYGSEFEVTIFDKKIKTTTHESTTYTSYRTNCKTIYSVKWGDKKGQVDTVEKSGPAAIKGDNGNYESSNEREEATTEVALTLADAWCAKYSQLYKYMGTERKVETSNVDLDSETVVTNKKLDGTDLAGRGSEALTEVSANHHNAKTKITGKTSYCDIEDRDKKLTVRVTEETSRWEAVGNGEGKWKADLDSDTPNFVTILADNTAAKEKLTNDVDSWIFEALELNDNTKNMIDLTKYFFYKATGNEYYKIDEPDFDTYKEDEFEEFEPDPISTTNVGWIYTVSFENKNLLDYRYGLGGDYETDRYINCYITKNKQKYKMMGDGFKKSGNRNFGLGVCFYDAKYKRWQQQEYFAEYQISEADLKAYDWGDLLDANIVDNISRNIYNDSEEYVKNLLNTKGINAEDYQIHVFTDIAYQYGKENDEVQKAMGVFKSVGPDENLLIASGLPCFSKARGKSRAHLLATGVYTDNEGNTIDMSKYAERMGKRGTIAYITETTLTRNQFIELTQSYSEGIGRGAMSQQFRNSAGLIYDVCVRNHINPVWCASQAWQEGNWAINRGASYQYWGIEAFNDTDTAKSYSSMEEAVQDYCDDVNNRINGGEGTVTLYWSEKLKKYGSEFTGSITTAYDVFASWAQVDDADQHEAEQYEHAKGYVNGIISIATKQIYGKNSLKEGGGVTTDEEAKELENIINTDWLHTQYHKENKMYQDGPFLKWWQNTGLEEFQCTWWAYGRASKYLEETNSKYSKYPRPDGLVGHGGQWYNRNKTYGWFNYGSTPKPNSIVSWKDGNAAGHVAYVEGVASDGSGIYISHAGSGESWFGVQKIDTDGSLWGYSLNGYIYLDEPK